ncbi:histidine kinase [Candidatus Nitrosotenuis cloacae]|uniref:histidine kinase n=1 Tax=Candidatus Nitrosotenuis cloacae TaxID=1603555 RepID=UPI00228000A9|nr:histidine kinase [Candidatus Nitrosotenuis cloacae]
MSKNTPEVVPDKIDSPISLKIITLIIASAISFHFGGYFFLGSEDFELATSIFSIASPLITGIAAATIATRYIFSKIFFRAYLCLAIAYVCAGIGEILFILYDYVLGEPAFPSVADLFFIPFYPLVLVHLVLNISFFRTKFNPKTIIWMSTLPIAIMILYLNLAWGTERDAQFFLSIYYIAVSSIALTMTIYGASVFRQGVLGKAWLLLLFGIIPFSAADLIYYYIETEYGYTLDHPVNLLWYAGYWIVIYALYKHKKIL